MSISSSYSFLKKTFTHQNITSLSLRAVVVIVRPILIIIAALHSETFAGKLGFYFIVSAVITSSLSFAYYKEYMQQAVTFGFLSVIKDINKDKLYDFLRDMEFNRLLSSAISTYGEVDFKDNRKEFSQAKPESKINKKK